jgi:hypothetical protein
LPSFEACREGVSLADLARELVSQLGGRINQEKAAALYEIRLDLDLSLSHLAVHARDLLGGLFYSDVIKEIPR